MLVQQIKKRSGEIEEFNPDKLNNSIKQSISSAGLEDNPISDKLNDEILKYLKSIYPYEQTITTDDIRSAVNIVLLENNLPQVAKIYFKMRGSKLSEQQKIFTGTKKIKKRDGTIINFDKNKIFSVIIKAGKTTEEFDEIEAKKLTDIVASVLEHKFDNNNIPTVEQIQDIIEIIFIQANWARTAKAFIIYREERKKIRLSEDKEVISPEVTKLEEQNIFLSPQAKHILNNSTQFDELGRIIFLDRYSIKDKRESIAVGDLVVIITKEDYKYPKKDLGIVRQILRDENVILHMLTGIYADDNNGSRFEQDLYKCDKPRESIKDTHRRIAKAVSSMEKNEKDKEKYFEIFFDQLRKQHIQPAGRIMTGANVDQHGNYTSNLTLFNCYVLPSPRDSRKGIIRDTLHQMVEVMSRGGGVGLSLSALRPRYAYVRGVHGKSSGSVSWGGLFSHVTGLIEQGGSRRGALMLTQWDWHPDVLEFISAKTKKGKIENANVSVMISDDFMEAIKKDGYWNLEFPDYENPAYNDIYDNIWNGDLKAWKKAGYPVKIYKTIKARKLWDKIMTHAHASAEPGIVFMDRYNKLSNSYYFNKIICTNPCGEQGLPGWGVCNLGHLYLGSFVKHIGDDDNGPVYEMDWDELKKSAHILTRFLDNVIDLTPYHFQENEDNQKNERRIGGGTLGLGELLIKLRLKYGSEKSLEFIEKLYKTITIEMYKESCNLALAKGPFPKFELNKYLESGFMQNMPEEIKVEIRKNGIRNVTLTTQAPTGTVGSMLSTSTGIEPYYAFKFFRQSRLGFHEVFIPIAEEYRNNGNLPKFFVGAMDLNPIEHIKVQATVQKWTDSSISKTANVPADFTVKETTELYQQAYELGCKGVTIYRDNSRNEQVLSTEVETEKKNLAYNGENKEKKVTSITAKELNTKTIEEIEKIPITANISTDNVKIEINEMQNPSKHKATETDVGQDIYGSEVGKICPQCKKGVMVKIGGCTECSKQCGFKGGCDLK